MKCKNCGFDNPKQAKFCIGCGTVLKNRKPKFWQVGLGSCAVLLIGGISFLYLTGSINQVKTNQNHSKKTNKSDVSALVKENLSYSSMRIIPDSENSFVFIADDGRLCSYDFKWGEFETKMYDIASISYAPYSYCAINRNGDLYTWGDNTFGNLGNGTAQEGSYESEPSQIMKNIEFASMELTCVAISKNKELYLWGYCGNLEKGDESVPHGAGYYTPVLLKPRKILDDIVYASAGGKIGKGYNAAIASNGDLYMFGDEFYWDGSGEYTEQWKPTKCMENIISVDVGDGYFAAVTSENVLYTWGFNSRGRLGNGSEDTVYKPTKIMDNVAYCNLGEDVSYAITTNGELYLWGCDSNQEVGMVVNSLTPKKVMDNVRFCTLSPYEDRVAVITNDNTLYIWGSNNFGEIGNGTTENSKNPVKVMENVDAVALGEFGSAAITKKSELYVWGHDVETETLDDGNTFDVDALSPVLIEVLI